VRGLTWTDIHTETMATTPYPPPSQHPFTAPRPILLKVLFGRSQPPEHHAPRSLATRIVYTTPISSRPLAMLKHPPHEHDRAQANRCDPACQRTSLLRVTAAPSPSCVGHVVHVAAAEGRVPVKREGGLRRATPPRWYQSLAGTGAGPTAVL
jgi:hypothetical protein